MSIATRSTTGAALAAVAATLFLTAPIAVSAAHKAPQGHCMGANSCKGKSACKTAHNDCKGQNSCKGEGFTAASKAKCKKAGGKFEMPKT